MSEMSWYGRIYVDESDITPEQYKEFFDHGYYVIKFDIANSILKHMNDEGNEECVPADQLNDEARRQIKEQAMDGNTSGTIEMYGRTLDWNWDPTIRRDGEDITWDDVEDWEKEKILTDMLDNECHMGMW